MTRARVELYLTRAERRLRFGTVSERPPSRFLEEIPPQLVKTIGVPERPVRRAPTGPVMDYSYSQLGDAPSETVAHGGLAAGTKVRHPTFGVGFVRRSEGSGDNEKLTVQFARAGMKKLIRRFANLEVLIEAAEMPMSARANPARYQSR
jgi:DNA helicase-2/ATP-dependent DNA helicase PcrA